VSRQKESPLGRSHVVEVDLIVENGWHCAGLDRFADRTSHAAHPVCVSKELLEHDSIELVASGWYT
jgi:hypothetical protein